MKILHLCWTTFGNKIRYWKKWPSRLRVKGLTNNNKPALVQVMAWCTRGNKPLPEPKPINFDDAIWCHYKADSRFATSQWETSLQSNAVSHWLGAITRPQWIARVISHISHVIINSFTHVSKFPFFSQMSFSKQWSACKCLRFDYGFELWLWLHSNYFKKSPLANISALV